VDRIIEKKKWNSKRILTIAGIAALVLLIAFSIIFTSGKSALSVDADRITISEVVKSNFKEFIPINGIVMPLTTIYLDANEGGRVEEKFVEDGAMMKKGDPILRMSNTDLMMNLVNQQSNVYNSLMQMQLSENTARQNTVNQQQTLSTVESDLKEAERQYKLNKQLADEKVIARQDMVQAEIKYNFLVKRQDLTKQILRQDSITSDEQLKQNRQVYSSAQNSLELMKKKVGDLIVRAPIDGQLTSLDAEVGQSKTQGTRLGQIDVVGAYKVRADIDEHYITRVFPDLRGDCTLGDGKTYQLVIKKVFTQVANGRFQVDMAFTGTAPTNIRRGQTLQIRLALGDETQAVLIPKGGFYQQTGGNWIFKLTKDGKTAYKTDIQINRQNPDYFEVVQGLQPGDKVVTSSYDNYGTVQELKIK
jgi:HlyD family secretion protein